MARVYRGQFPRPVVLITSDVAASTSPAEDVYHVRCAYARVLENAGALPLVIAHSDDLPERLGAICDGVMFTGSAPGSLQSKARGEFEARLVAAALQQDLPVLGICHGMQVLGQALGAELRDLAGFDVDHNPETGPSQVAHKVQVMEGSLLWELSKGADITVNSMHRQELIGRGRFTVVAKAADGVVEAIEGKTSTFCMGLQWHPEYGLTDTDSQIVSAFVTACTAQMYAKLPPEEL